MASSVSLVGLSTFEERLKERIRAGEVEDESDIIRICIEYGMTRQHAKPVLQRLRKEGVIRCDFFVPDIGRLKAPRPITLLSR